MHEDGRFLYPGTGSRSETGRGAARARSSTCRCRPARATTRFSRRGRRSSAISTHAAPELILLQCGADSLAGDPITHLRYSAEAHAHAARRLRALADRHAAGRLLAMGGGGYNRANLARAWTRVVEELAA